MALDDVVRIGSSYLHIEAADKNREEKKYTSALNHYLTCALQLGYVGRRTLENMKDHLRENHGELDERIESGKEIVGNKLASIVSQNYKGVINGLPNDSLSDIAIEIPDKNKIFKVIEKLNESFEKKKGKITKKDYDMLKTAYAASSPDNEIFQDFVMNTGKEFLLRNAFDYVEDEKEKFLGGYAKEVERNGKKVRELDNDKLRAYIVDNTKYEGDEDRNEAYRLIGKAYTGFKLYEEAEKEKEKAEKQKGGNKQTRKQRSGKKKK